MENPTSAWAWRRGHSRKNSNSHWDMADADVQLRELHKNPLQLPMA